MEKIKNKIRIAMVSLVSDPIAPVGGRRSGAGASIYILELARMLSKKGIYVDIFTRWDNRKSAHTVRIAQRCRLIRIKAGPRHYIPKDNLEPYVPEFIEHFLLYMRENKTKYNLIHSHQYVSGWVSLRLKEVLNIPLIHTLHSLGKAKEQSLTGTKISDARFQLEKMIIQGSDQVIATNPKEKLMVVKHYGFNGNNIGVIPAGFNLNRFNRLDKKVVRKKLNIPNDRQIILFAARMDEDKGGLVLTEAVRWLKSYHNNVYNNITVFMFSGDPRKTHHSDNIENRFRKKLTKSISEHGLDEAVILAPAIDQHKLHLYYSASDIVVMPSYFESFGMVALESMACGTPVVASDVGGLQWVVQEGITGLHAKAGNGKDLGKKILHLLTNPKTRERMGENSYIISHQGFTWDIVADKMMNLYHSLLNKGK